jgi:twinkle protein
MAYLSRLIRHDACENCGSSDGNAVYDDGHTYCFVCETAAFEYNENKKEYKKIDNEIYLSKLTPLPSKSTALKSRGIDASTIQKYMVTVNTSPDNDVECVFPRFNNDGEHSSNQIRYKDKAFKCEGDIKGSTLFGQTVFPSGGRSITVTEGYYDALSAFQLTGSRYPNVAVMSASTAKKEVVNSFEYLNSFSEIIINFDSDEPGQKAAKECASLFNPGKVRILKLSEAKDANDYLMGGLTKRYVDEWFRAPPFMPDGLQLGSDPALLDEIIKYKEPKCVLYPWEGLNHKTYGMRTSEFVLIKADTGVGKTSFCKEIEYALLTNAELIAEECGVGFLHFEEPKRDLALGLMSIHNDKPYHFPDVARTEEELREAYKAVMDTSRVVVYDHFGSNDIDIVLAKIRHMAALGCRYIFVDHLSIIVSDQSGDERKQLDEISTKLKMLTMNLDINIHCVIHINRKGEVRGSAGPEQVANIILDLSRDKKDPNDWRRNCTVVSVDKNRKYGRTGPACVLHYSETSGRMEELSKDLTEVYFQGGSNVGNEFDGYSK